MESPPRPTWPNAACASPCSRRTPNPEDAATILAAADITSTPATVHGAEKLITLNELTRVYQEFNIRKSIKYGKQAVALSDILYPEGDSLSQDGRYYLKADAYNLLAESHYLKSNYYDAQVNFKLAATYAEKVDYHQGKEIADSYLHALDSIGVKPNIFKETFGDLKIGRTIKTGSEEIILNSTLKAAESHENNGNYLKAIENYEKAINILEDRGEKDMITDLYLKIADNYKKAGNISKSLEYYNLAIDEKEKAGDTTDIRASRESISELHEQINEIVDSREATVDTAKLKAQIQSREEFMQLAQESEANEDYEQSLEYYKLYKELNDKITEDERKQEIALMEKTHEIERNLQEIQLLTQDKEIQELELSRKEIELKEQNKFRNNLIIGVLMLLALASTLYLLYFNKRRDHKRLNIAHADLQSTQDQLINAEKKIKTLLDQQLSTEVAEQLLSESSDEGKQRKQVCVMFLDIRGFTTFADRKNPEEIIDYQNDVFGFMIEAVYKNHGIINQFLGDGFMATFGAPKSTGNDSQNAFDAAREIITKVNQKSNTGEIPETKVGIGLHTGKVVVGNVGTSLRKQYSITGTAVIIAARIEQLNKDYQSQLLISGEVLQKLDSIITDYKSLGEVQLKGMEKPVEIFRIL